VPNPNPEKKVRILPTKTTRGIITISNSLNFQRKYELHYKKE
jgi:hypothetical protein